MKVFAAKDYRTFVKRTIEQNSTQRGYQSRLAEAAGCQRSFLSQVLRSHVHLTPDHAGGMAHFWGLNDDETEYFVGMVQLERATSPHLIQHLKARLAALRERNSDLARRFERPQLDQTADQLRYYSSWIYSAVHILVSIPQFQTPESIATRLGISRDRALTTLRRLEAMSLVKLSSGRWTMTSADLHLSKDSPMNATHHGNWRRRAVDNSAEDSPLSLHYTAIHSLSLADVMEVRELIVATIENSRKVVAASPEEELYCLSADFFRI